MTVLDINYVHSAELRSVPVIAYVRVYINGHHIGHSRSISCKTRSLNYQVNLENIREDSIINLSIFNERLRRDTLVTNVVFNFEEILKSGLMTFTQSEYFDNHGSYITVKFDLVNVR